ncbi:hypothetical protein [Gordonia spumicola]|nr:hypothetical protein [Gordonia spumicola]
MMELDENAPIGGAGLDHWRPTPDQLSLVAGLTARYLDDDPAATIMFIRAFTRFGPHRRDGVDDGLVQLALAFMQTIDETLAAGDRDRLIARLQSSAVRYRELDLDDVSMRVDGQPQIDHTLEQEKHHD